jgi:hypothetical protein
MGQDFYNTKTDEDIRGFKYILAYANVVFPDFEKHTEGKMGRAKLVKLKIALWRGLARRLSITPDDTIKQLTFMEEQEFGEAIRMLRFLDEAIRDRATIEWSY